MLYLNSLPVSSSQHFLYENSDSTTAFVTPNWKFYYDYSDFFFMLQVHSKWNAL